ncbi:Ferritin BfrB [Shimia thalassica]|uniref:Ferritin n=1 Tax=Shimia thalassica TaxID=1715693 RepID=A0A0P1IL72_9RHOB|nr:ferritin [Shimia thalassica]CUJ82661.1 Ferritin BfrB [Shimia thalassica]
MKMNPEVAEALNAQINAELQASYTYLSMAAYFDSVALPGFAAWFRSQSLEENEHAMRIYDFVVKREGRVVLEGNSKPKGSYNTPETAIAAALEMEQGVTAQINALFALAKEHDDYSAQHMLNWFLDEQIEEEDVFATVLDKARAADGNRWFLLELDKELGAERPLPSPDDA